MNQILKDYLRTFQDREYEALKSHRRLNPPSAEERVGELLERYLKREENRSRQRARELARLRASMFHFPKYRKLSYPYRPYPYPY